MKKPSIRILGGFFSLPFFLFLFALVSIASLILLRKGISGLSDPAFFQGPQAFLLLFALPLSLIVLAAAFFYALHSEMLKTAKIHSSAMRHFRLAVIFAALLSAIFCIFVSLLITDLFSVYHDESIPQAMESSLEMAEAFAQARLLQAETAAERFLTGYGIWSLARNPQSWLPLLRSYDPYALAVQVYEEGEGGNLAAIKEEGDSSAFLGTGLLALMRDGVTATEGGGEGNGLIRLKKTLRYAGFTYISLYTSLMPQEIYRVTKAAQKASNSFYVIQSSKPFFPFFGFWLYFAFILPPMLILLLCAFYACVRLSDPIAAIESACEGLSQGKAEASLIPQKYAGLDSTFAFLNARSDAMHYGQAAARKARDGKYPKNGDGE